MANFHNNSPVQFFSNTSNMFSFFASHVSQVKLRGVVHVIHVENARVRHDSSVSRNDSDVPEKMADCHEIWPLSLIS